jgi:hypothetical protein
LFFEIPQNPKDVNLFRNKRNCCEKSENPNKGKMLVDATEVGEETVVAPEFSRRATAMVGHLVLSGGPRIPPPWWLSIVRANEFNPYGMLLGYRRITDVN